MSDIVCDKFRDIVSKISRDYYLGDEGEYDYFFFSFEDACRELGIHPRAYKSWREKIEEMSKNAEGQSKWIEYREGIQWVNKGEYFWWLTEEGLFYLILQSKTDKAKKFQKWLIEDVLMSLEKTARYSLKKEEFHKNYQQPD